MRSRDRLVASTASDGFSLVLGEAESEVESQRVYLVNQKEDAYEKFKLINAEVAFDVNLGGIKCGMNAGVYSVEMPADGKTPGSTGTPLGGGGYCDSNFAGGVGCSEFDLSEGNAFATVATSHPCNITGFAAQNEIHCDGIGDAMNPYTSNKQFYGPDASFDINTNEAFTIVTQFVGEPALTAIRRLYIQNGNVFEQRESITTHLEEISRSFAEGHVLVWWLWTSGGGMRWLDSGENGPCDGADESPEYLLKNYPKASVYYSNLRYGPLNSTF